MMIQCLLPHHTQLSIFLGQQLWTSLFGYRPEVFSTISGRDTLLGFRRLDDLSIKELVISIDFFNFDLKVCHNRIAIRSEVIDAFSVSSHQIHDQLAQLLLRILRFSTVLQLDVSDFVVVKREEEFLVESSPSLARLALLSYFRNDVTQTHYQTPIINQYQLFALARQTLPEIKPNCFFIDDYTFSSGMSISRQLLLEINQNNMSKQQPQYFKICSKSSGRVLDLGQHGDNKGKLIIYDDWEGEHQQFGIVQISPLQVLLINRKSGLCLTLANNSDKNGAVIIEQAYKNLPSQRFRLQEISPASGEYVIFTFSGKALDCCENETKNNTRIIQWDFHAKDNQKWVLKKI